MELDKLSITTGCRELVQITRHPSRQIAALTSQPLLVDLEPFRDVTKPVLGMISDIRRPIGCGHRHNEAECRSRGVR